MSRMTVAPAATQQGLRAFEVESRAQESEQITSFTLRPTDGLPPPPHRAGQHLVLFADIPGAGRQKRNYTISCAPNGRSFRISVKREDRGTVSRWLHDFAQPGTRLDIGGPGGSFALDAARAHPMVLLSAGVGQSPMVAMLEALAIDGASAPVHAIHCTRNGRLHAFGAHVRNIAATTAGVTSTVFYTQPDADDAAQGRFDVEGRVTLDWLAEHTSLAEAGYFICGPFEFLKTFVCGLARMGVSRERLHHEFFGPVADLWDEDDGAPSAPPSSATGATRTSRLTGGFTRVAIGDAMIDAAGDGVVVSDAQGTITLWNPGAERIFGFSEDEALGKSLDIIIPEPFRARHWEGYRETVASGQSRYGAGDLLAVPGLRRDGKRISIEFTIVLVKDSADCVTGMVATIRDVSARFDETKALKKKIADLEARVG